LRYASHTEFLKPPDFANPDNNDWLAVNQFTVVENKQNRRPDVVIFINGLPLGVIELKNAADEGATIWDAYQQLQTYQAEIHSLFAYNETLLISDGVQARVGSLGAGREWFKPWRTITGETIAENYLPELQVMIQGVFDRRRFLDLLRYFVVFEDFGGGAVAKKIAGYHQFHAVNVAVQETLRAARMRADAEEWRDPADGYKSLKQAGGRPGDRRVGVVWHTQGSGKILSDDFLAEIRGMPRKNLAVELLRKLLNGEIQTRRKKNVVQAKSFATMLEQSIRKYQNRAIEAAQIIEEMIALAKDMRRANERGATLKLTDEELAFYDALETNDSAVQVLGDETLRTIAREVTNAVRQNVTIDWTMRENVRAQLRVIIKRILRKYGYPPDKQEKATQTVLEQVELLGWEVTA
jgi:type I site-specific restriction-modification system R (restriction) subunit